MHVSAYTLAEMVDHERESESTTWTLVQPTARREWELRRGTEVRASLRIPTFRSGARAETSDRRLRIQRAGGLRASYAVLDETSGAEIGRLRREGRRRVLELDGLIGEWRNLGRKHGFGFVGEDGDPFVTAKVRSGLLRSSGEVKVNANLDERAAIVAALLACYLLIRRNEETATGAAASTAAVGS